MKVYARILAVVAVTILIASSLSGLNARPAAAASATPFCTDIYILGARGTGQPENDKGIGGWYADVIGRTVDQFKAQVRERDGAIEFHDIALTGDQYPAEGGWYFTGAALKMPSTYHKSVVKGKDSGRQQIQNVIGNAGACVLFTGYSQGAQVTADLMEEFTSSHPAKVLGGVFYGDPYFRGDSNHASSGLWPNPYNPTQHGGLGQRAEFPTSLASRVISTCHGKDPVCQGVSWQPPVCLRTSSIPFVRCEAPKPDVDFDAHSAYTRDASNPANRGNDMTAEAANSARAIVSRMGFARPTAPRYSGPVDVVFAVDTTGSMGGVIEDAKAYVRAFPAANDAALPDVRYGLVAYKDTGDVYVTRVEAQPTADRAVFTAAVDRLSASGGGDFPEAVLAAASTAMTTDLRPVARKIVIFVGDAPGHDPDLLTGQTLSDVTSEAVRRSIVLSAVDYGGGVQTFRDLSTATGGKVVNPFTGASPLAAPLARGFSLGAPTGESQNNANTEPKPSALAAEPMAMATVPVAAGDGVEPVNPLLEAVLKSVALPEARLSPVLPAYAGIPAGLDASGSSDPIGYIAKYEWDFDGDGVYDETTDYPTVQHVFADPGARTVGLRITNDVGETGLATADVLVEELPIGYPEAAPSTPGEPVAVAGDSSAEITIVPSTTGARPYAYSILDAATGDVLATVTADGDGSPTGPVTLTELTNGERYSFKVIASNVRGESAASAASNVVTPSKPDTSVWQAEVRVGGAKRASFTSELSQAVLAGDPKMPTSISIAAAPGQRAFKLDVKQAAARKPVYAGTMTYVDRGGATVSTKVVGTWNGDRLLLTGLWSQVSKPKVAGWFVIDIDQIII